jgi:tetratricopeptide (TPR) repeat protein
MLGFYRFADVGEMKEKARVAAEKALELNDSLADAYVALASMHILEPAHHDYAQQLLERAIALAPYNASARHRYGWILISKGLLDEGTREMRLAQRYDPLSFATNKALCSTLIFQRNFGEAAAYWERVVELSPDTPGNKATLAYIYTLNKRYDEAIELVGQEKEIRGKAEWLRITQAYIFAVSGRLAEAEKIYDEVKSDAEKHTPLLSHLALTSYALGRKQESLAYFKEMIQKVDSIPDQRLLLAYSPDWDKFKADPEFAPLFPK